MHHFLTFLYANIIKDNFPQFSLYLLKKNIITILCQFLTHQLVGTIRHISQYNSMNHLNVHVYPLSWTCLPSLTSHPSRSSQLAELPVLYNRSPLVICFTHGSVYMSKLLSSSQPLLPAHHVHMSFMSCLYSCPGNRFICTIFLDSAQMH